MLAAYFVVQAALARWLTPDVAVAGLASLSVLVFFAVLGASLLRRVFPTSWRPVGGVLAFLLLLVSLFVLGFAAECMVGPTCFG
jgi:hypothetical protein